jgi:hypothetical protein
MRLRRAGFAFVVAIASTIGASVDFASIAHAAPRTRGASTGADANVSRAIVGVGDTFSYTLTAPPMSGTENASVDPGKLDGFEAVGRPQQSSSQTISVVNGRQTISMTLSLKYTLRARKIGTFTLGPAVFTIDGTRVSAPPVAVQVVAAGKAPPAPPVDHSDPFDDLFNMPMIPQAPPPAEDDAPPDPLARVDSVPEIAARQHAFVRLVLDDASPVVGAPLHARLYKYSNVPAHVDVKRPPSFGDFFAVELQQNDRNWHKLKIGEEQWQYAIVDEWVLFPLRAGKLDIGAGEVEATGMSPFGRPIGDTIDLSSNEASVTVVEPPIADRPAGYVIGDVVGSLTVEASIAPAHVTDGHAIAKVVLKGNGRVDHVRIAPELPQASGAQLTQTSDVVRSINDRDHVVSTRTVLYDVALSHGGELDLGSVSVTVWDYEKKRYFTVRAPIGHVDAVAPSASASASASVLVTGTETFAPPPPRDAIGRRGEGSAIGERAVAWAVVPAMPLTVLAAQGAVALWRSRRKRAATAIVKTPEMFIAEARRSASEGDRGHALAMATKAIDVAIGLLDASAAHATTSAERRTRIEARGGDEAIVAGVEALLDRLGAERFAGKSSAIDAAIEDASRVVATLRTLGSSRGEA